MMPGLSKLLEDEEYRKANRDPIRAIFSNAILTEILADMEEAVISELSGIKSDSYNSERKNCIIARLQAIRQIKDSLKQLAHAVEIEDSP